jgi:Protein of unknown function (DUF2829)
MPLFSFGGDMEEVKFDFSKALEFVKSDHKIARQGWNGKGMWLLLVRDWTIGMEYSEVVIGLLPIPFIAMKTADGCFIPWLASQTDILADDWCVLGK